MIKYGDETYIDHQFALSCSEVERRGQWIDVYLDIAMEPGQVLPEGLVSPSALVICDLEGDIVQMVLLDEGCDSEFQFTYGEKERIRQFVKERCAAFKTRLAAGMNERTDTNPNHEFLNDEHLRRLIAQPTALLSKASS